ncbi:HNH endonuclease [Enhygromyxa salina]|uniref:HNH endonuclease n=1 Tax=Enhygromyxa salina TaxID=215803 RepID=A0A2S9XLV8_9BACT|nr:HNH endonuclease signature motif containing protein [Enhygromyxa salina]PRP93859.1 HNH endonuclease [Enhygromyxa salina]
MLDGVKSLTPGAGVTTPHPLEGFTDSMLPSDGPSQERRRLNVSAETADRVSQVMQDPPTYVVISIEITLFMIGGDAEAVGALIEGGVKVVSRRGGEEALPLVAGTLKKEGKKGAANGRRAGKRHTAAANRNSRAQSDGICPKCGTEMTEPTRRVKGSKVNPAEAQGDHIYPRSRGGDGATVDDMRNLETICAKCNRAKGATIE